MVPLKVVLLVMLCPFLAVVPMSAGITWEQKTLSFQPAAADTEVVAHFKFQNTGNSPLVIKSVAAACTCTRAQVDKRSYAAGESGEVTAKFSLGDRVGKQTEEITVETDDPVPPPTLLKMLVTIPKLATVEPDPVRWLPGEILQPKRVRVILTQGLPIKLTVAEPSTPDFSARIEAGASPGVFEVLITPKEVRQSVSGFLRIETNFPKDHPKALSVRVQVAR